MLKNEFAVVCDSAEFDSEHVLQILSKVRLLAGSAQNKVMVVCVGPYQTERLRVLSRYGADHIVICERAAITDMDEYSNIVGAIIQEQKPAVVLFPATDFGKAAAARLSARLGLGLTADCIDFSLEDDFYFFRAAMNQSVIAKIKCINCDIRMGTVKKDVFLPQERPAGNEAFAKVFIERFEYYSDKDLSRKNLLEVLDRVELQAKKRINIHEHPISFCLGRGVKQKDTKDRILDLAQRCSANVIGTRAAVEMGMIEKERQVGQSGRSVAPQIYVGFGVSGASQHIVGIKNAGLVVAVNNDKNAAIFDYADYQIIDNLESIVGEMDRLIPGNFA